jgi:hypothetical protein
VTTGASRPVRVPAGFAAAGGQAETQDGAVRVYTAQSPAFVNPPNTATAGMPAVTRPLGISVNNAFGRPWIASAGGDVGVESVLDPDGAPLADPPSKRAAGVFAGSLTDRRPQRQDGDLTAPAGGNALLGASPDARNRAVFAVVTADGALAQVHVEDGVDGLAPPGTIAPTRGRVGMVFNWVPDRFLYVTDPRNDAVVQLRLDDDYHVFEVEAVRRLESSQFSEPIDLAPAVPEIANPAFSSNTTLAGGADIYVANRGTGTIARLTQSGHVRAVATVVLPGSGAIGPGRLNGIASDNGRIWLTVDDKVVEVDGFG